MLNTEFKLAQIINKGFTRHEELNPKLFDENQTLRKEVRDQLIIIANDFIDSLHIDHTDFDDILVLGSIANYNWNPYSDVDLHVVYDFKEINDDVDLVTEFFLAKKSEWNQEHDVKIYGYDVELYGQDINEHVESGGIYSVMKNEWIQIPKQNDYQISEESLIKKTKHFMRIIDDVLKLDASDESKIKKLKTIKDKIKKYRQSGLEHGGEFSEENLVFKMLRRTKYMDKLSDSRHALEDKIMSLPEGVNIESKQPLLKFSDLPEKDVPKNVKDNYDRGKKLTKEHSISKKFYKKLNGLEIYIVDGKYIRDNIDINWTQGGHGYIYPNYIPINEIWIDKANIEEIEDIIVHEFEERKKMVDGMGYDDAHEDYANVAEKKKRDKEKTNPQRYKTVMEGLNLVKKKYTLIPIKFLGTGEIEQWPMDEVLDEINRGHSVDFINYTPEDWEIGWDEWVEGNYYTRHV